jgi:hypothetical protein
VRAIALLVLLLAMPARALEPCRSSVVIRPPADATCAGILTPSERVRELLTIERVELPAVRVEMLAERERHAAELARVRAVAKADIEAAELRATPQQTSALEVLGYIGIGMLIGAAAAGGLLLAR